MPRNPKVLILFAAYNKDGVVEDYAVEYVKRLAELGDVHYFMDNEIREGAEKLAPYVASCAGRRHARYDFYSWLLMMDSIGREAMASYDWLVLANDSCFCLGGMKEDFARMAAAGEMWCFTHNVRRYHHHMQSYFMCFPKSVFARPEFGNIFAAVKKIRTKEQAVRFERSLGEKVFKLVPQRRRWPPRQRGKFRAIVGDCNCYCPRKILRRGGWLLKTSLFRTPRASNEDMTGIYGLIRRAHPGFDLGLIERHVERAGVDFGLAVRESVKPRRTYKTWAGARTVCPRLPLAAAYFAFGNLYAFMDRNFLGNLVLKPLRHVPRYCSRLARLASRLVSK